LNLQAIENKDLFEFWLMDMDEALDNFLKALPDDTRQCMNYSPNSLQVLEEWLLSKYSDTDVMLSMSESKLVDGAARYIGEVFRKTLGGKWFVDFKDEKNAFYGLPQLNSMPGQKIQVCPLTMATALADRRTGKFLQMIYQNNKLNAEAVK
jgi:hypothetical protein